MEMYGMQKGRTSTLKRQRDVIDTRSDFIEGLAIDRRIRIDTMQPSWNVTTTMPFERVDVASRRCSTERGAGLNSDVAPGGRDRRDGSGGGRAGTRRSRWVGTKATVIVC